MTLSVVPCSAFELRDEHQTEASEKQNHDCNENNDDCCNDCSPFYVCCTCIGFTFTSPTAPSFAIQLKQIQHNTPYLPVNMGIVPANIWQPPKLA